MSIFAFDWVMEHAARDPAAPAIGIPDRWTSYGELAGWMQHLAAELGPAGVAEGSFVIFALPPGPAAAAAVLAAQLLGACAVELNRELDDRSFERILAQTGARHAFIHGRDVGRWARLVSAPAIDHLYVVFPTEPPPRMQEALRGISWSWVSERPPAAGEHAGMARKDVSTSQAAGHPSIPPAPTGSSEVHHGSPRPGAAKADAPALLVYTSGSTGEPRGVIQTHANIHANTVAISSYLELSSADRALSTLPLFYCYGRSILQTHLFVGGSVFFDHRFMYPRVVMEAIAEQKCTGFYGVPLTFESLRAQVDLRALPLGGLRYVAQAGGAMRAETIGWCREVFAPARLFVMYGQTEATARLSFLPPEFADEKKGSIGRGVSNVTLRVVDPAGRELPPREVGELIASGPSISPGYHCAPEESAAIFRDGWLWTGDLGFRDEDGFIFLVGRAKEMLKLGGHRVSPAEIEEVLLEDRRVEEAAVVGVPDLAGGEAAVAFVTAADGHQPVDPDELRRHCRQRMPAFKVPREIRVCDVLPRTATGKLAKAELRREYLDEGSLLEGRARTGLGAEGG